MESGGADAVSARQKEFQEALLKYVKPDVYSALSRDEIEAVDDAIESVISKEDILASTKWDDLAYVWGFFNRDVTAREIRDAAEGWREMPMEERRRAYPKYIHWIDAVAKPLSMGPLFNEDTGEGLRIAVPLLKEMVSQPPRGGRAFHEPSHAALVIGPLYERWADDEEHGAIIREILGDREEFEKLLWSQLAGAVERDDQLTDTERRFYFYTGRYLANALARFDGRAAVPALKRSLKIYREQNAPDSTIRYTRRALATLGDEAERDAIEEQLESNPERARSTLVWIAGNGKGEAAAWARGLLERGK